MDSNSRGQIITFYSYKGGTGRSMALANVACVLAERQAQNGGKGVLMIDWDLEAPGLHRYFKNRLTTSTLGIERIEKGDTIDAKPGLIDLFCALDQRTDYYLKKQQEEQRDQSTPSPPNAETLARSAINDVNLTQYILSTTIKGLCLIKAGAFFSNEPGKYSERVSKFNWEALYRKSPQLIRILAETLARDYGYVLIDSRTGVTDISGICTMLLPEKLVVVFTPNLQSLTGGIDLIRQATNYRKESSDLRSLMVFPLVSRVEANEPDLRHDWRFGTPKIPGYQPEFEKLLAEVYERDGIKFDKYFDEMQIQHIPRYAYGEEIAVLSERIGDKFSLRRSYQTFADRLTENRPPWEGEINEAPIGDGGVSLISTLLNALVETLSLGGATRPVRAMIYSVTLAVAVLAIVFAYAQSYSATATASRMQAQLSEYQRQNTTLQLQVTELQKPLKQILDDNKKIVDTLTNQLSDAQKELAAANQTAATQQSRADAAEAAARVALDDAKKSKAQIADALNAKSQAEAAQQLAVKDRDGLFQKNSACQSTVNKLTVQIEAIKNPKAQAR